MTGRMGVEYTIERRNIFEDNKDRDKRAKQSRSQIVIGSKTNLFIYDRPPCPLIEGLLQSMTSGKTKCEFYAFINFHDLLTGEGRNP